MPKILIVGAGLTGATLAQQAAAAGHEVMLLEKRAHLAGNCYDELDEQSGIRVSRYGAHLFHTNSERVFDYLRQFAKWRSYEHRVLVKVGRQLLPLPVNLTTVEKFFKVKLADEASMREFLNKKVQAARQPEKKNQAKAPSSADYVLENLGPGLYEAIYHHYSLKQWALSPSELDASVIRRNPVRFSRDERYFTDRYQALPSKGFSALVERMLASAKIEVSLDTDFTKWRSKNDLAAFSKIFYTGAIDQYFDYRLGHLEYRSLDFHFSREKVARYQAAGAVNYPSPEPAYTRIIEYKHFYPPEKDSQETIISKEYPTWEGEPYYPVPRARNQTLLRRYQALARQERERYPLYFCGRLGSYRYINMDQAVAEALQLWARVGKGEN